MEFEAGVVVDELRELACLFADLVDQSAESCASEGFQGDGDLEHVGAAGGAQGAAEEVGEAGLGVVVGVEVVGALVEGGEVVLVAYGEESCGYGLPAEFVQVEGDGVGGVDAGELVSVPGAEEETAAICRVDVQAGAVSCAQVRDLGQRVDLSGVCGACGGSDEEGALEGAEGGLQVCGVEGGEGGGVGHS